MTHDFRDKETSTSPSGSARTEPTAHQLSPGRARASRRPCSAKTKLPRETGKHWEQIVSFSPSLSHKRNMMYIHPFSCAADRWLADSKSLLLQHQRWEVCAIRIYCTVSIRFLPNCFTQCHFLHSANREPDRGGRFTKSLRGQMS